MAITQLTTNGKSDSPDIFGDRIVWAEDRKKIVLFDGISATVLPNSGVSLMINPEISAEGILWYGWVNGWQSFYDDGNTTTQLTSYSDTSDEKLSENLVVWRSAPAHTPTGELYEVYLYDGNTQETRQLTDNDIREQSVDISGENVVWKGAGNTVYLYDGSTTIELTDNGVSPYVSGNQVVWESYTGGRKDQINLYDGNSTSQIVQDDSIRLQGFFDGNVVWSQWDGNDFELFRYDGSNTLQITDNDFNDRLNPDSTPSSSGASSKTALDGSGDSLVWSSYVGNNWEIFYYDGTETIQLTDNDVDDFNPKISGNRVVWNSDGATSDIFLYEPDATSDPVIFADDFDPGIDDSQWKKVKNAIANNNFGGSDKSLYFSGGSFGGGSRFATSNALDLTGGGFISFDLIFGDSSNGGENADGGEDVALEYSVDQGISWSLLAQYDTEDYTTWSTLLEAIPSTAQTTATNLRWRQVRQSGSTFDNWGLDNVQVSSELSNFAPQGIDATFSLAENSEDNTLVGMVVASDPNAEQTLSYSIKSGNNAGAFTINGDGELTVADSVPLDYEATPSFDLEIEISDNGLPSLQDTVLITVDLIDVYEGEILNSIAEDFQPDIDDSLWSSVGNSQINSKFGGDGKSLFFTGGQGNDDSRHLTTTGVNMANGGDISFDLIFGDSSNGGENADAREDVILEFSTDHGNSWQEIATYDTEAFTSWTGITETVPSNAQTENTQFRWLQVAHSGSRFDNWGLDNILIEDLSN